MRSRKILWGLSSLAVSSLFVVETAQADRRTGLGGNLLITDPDDLFPFPQYTLTHRNMIRLDYGGTATSGNGVLTLGDDDMAYGVSLHRGDLLSPDTVGFGQELVWLGGVGDPFADGTGANATGFAGPGGFTLQRPAGVQQGAPGEQVTVAPGAPLPATVVDVMFGGRLTGTSMWGARVGFGRGVQSQKIDGDTTKGATNFVALQGGFSSLPEAGLRMDLSANVVAGIGKATVAGEDASKGFDLRVGGLGRFYKPINQVVDLGFLGNVSLNYEQISDEANDTKANDLGVGLMGGVGPAIHLDRAQIAAYAGMLAAFGRTEPDDSLDDDESVHLQFALPSVNMAAEVQLLDWMYVRTGAQYTWEVRRSSSGDPETVNKLGTGGFVWSAGLGVTKSNFYLDGVISNGFMTNGPAFIGGGTPGFLAMASLTYKFGDVFSGAGVAAEPAAIEPPPPAPVVEPAPVVPAQEETVPAVDANGNATGTTTDTQVNGTVSGGLNIGQ